MQRAYIYLSRSKKTLLTAASLVQTFRTCCSSFVWWCWAARKGICSVSCSRSRCTTMTWRLSLKTGWKETMKNRIIQCLKSFAYGRASLLAKLTGGRKIPQGSSGRERFPQQCDWKGHTFLADWSMWKQNASLGPVRGFGEMETEHHVGKVISKVFRSLQKRRAWCLIAPSPVHSTLFQEPSRRIYRWGSTCCKSFLLLDTFFRLAPRLLQLWKNICFFQSINTLWVAM